MNAARFTSLFDNFATHVGRQPRRPHPDRSSSSCSGPCCWWRSRCSIWVVIFRKARKRKRVHHHHHRRARRDLSRLESSLNPSAPVPGSAAAARAHRPRNPTLAETGGLPPVRRPPPNPADSPPALMAMQQSQAITRKSASNLALAFVLLPKPKRDAMSALYAFCREVDDVADEESVPVEQRRAGLNAWRTDVRRACERRSAGVSGQPGIPAVHPAIPTALRPVR